jgi:hypothetical protein
MSAAPLGASPRCCGLCLGGASVRGPVLLVDDWRRLELVAPEAVRVDRLSVGRRPPYWCIAGEPGELPARRSCLRSAWSAPGPLVPPGAPGAYPLPSFQGLRVQTSLSSSSAWRYRQVPSPWGRRVYRRAFGCTVGGTLSWISRATTAGCASTTCAIRTRRGFATGRGPAEHGPGGHGPRAGLDLYTRRTADTGRTSPRWTTTRKPISDDRRCILAASIMLRNDEGPGRCSSRSPDQGLCWWAILGSNQ